MTEWYEHQNAFYTGLATIGMITVIGVASYVPKMIENYRADIKKQVVEFQIDNNLKALETNRLAIIETKMILQPTEKQYELLKDLNKSSYNPKPELEKLVGK